ncbi:hypothetical protein [Pseudomonas akapageensis]|uniref:hypothetical protein n=1 Tax=Pseudomonas akapageensis TaxID=2609961 RepID=UPI00140E45AD|nr:hypothetical protein [Pseudomonas akapageensis]
MFNCTEDFLTRHVRNLATGDIQDNYNDVVRYAGVVLQARVEEFEHKYPNTVMFMYPVTLGTIRDRIPIYGANANFDMAVRIPWIVTWTGVGRYTVIQNASGFRGSTDGAGLCNHYAAPLVDGQSVTTQWQAPGLL